MNAQIHFEDSFKLNSIKIEKSIYTDNNFNTLQNNNLLSGNQLMVENLEKIPGIQFYNMGPGNGRPAIRGLSGNRIGIYIDGLRIDNQQWQDEHGLSFISFDNDIQRIQFGPSANAISTDAIGGIISVEHNSNRNKGKMKTLGIGGTSNDLGFTLKYESNNNQDSQSNWFNIYYGSHGDFKDGKSNSILNSRFDLIQIKLGREKILNDQKTTRWNYRFSLSQTGIARIIDSFELAEVKKSDPREFEGPNHVVTLQSIAFNYKNFSKIWKTEFIAGFLSNTRVEMEDEKMNGLAMQLSTLLTRAIETTQWKHWNIELNQQFMLQNNLNFGNEQAVPNKNLVFSGFGVNISKTLNHFWLNIQSSICHEMVFFKDEERLNFTIPNFSLALNKKNNLRSELGIKISNSYRAPNLHELFANGMSEDAFRFDRGNSKFKSEGFTQCELNLCSKSKLKQLNMAIYIGKLSNFISLSQTEFKYNGAPIFQYISQGAYTWGGELTYSKSNSKQNLFMETSLGYSHIIANRSNIAFTPPLKIKTNLRYLHSSKYNLLNGIEMNAEGIFNQMIQPYFSIDKQIDHFFLFNFYLTKKIKQNKISFYVKNGFSNYYFDPMSMLKTVPYHAQGINFGFFYNHQF